jgi:hypothetical protein
VIPNSPVWELQIILEHIAVILNGSVAALALVKVLRDNQKPWRYDNQAGAVMSGWRPFGNVIVEDVWA